MRAAAVSFCDQLLTKGLQVNFQMLFWEWETGCTVVVVVVVVVRVDTVVDFAVNVDTVVAVNVDSAVVVAVNVDTVVVNVDANANANTAVDAVNVNAADTVVVVGSGTEIFGHYLLNEGNSVRYGLAFWERNCIVAVAAVAADRGEEASSMVRVSEGRSPCGGGLLLAVAVAAVAGSPLDSDSQNRLGYVETFVSMFTAAVRGKFGLTV